MKKWRIDESYEKVYRYENGEYMFYGSFFACNIDKRMSEQEQIKILDEGEED